MKRLILTIFHLFCCRELDAQFDLVLILERFDESLVLLQDLMCWPTEDIVYLKQNERIAKGIMNDNDRMKWIRFFGAQYSISHPFTIQYCINVQK